MGFLGVYKALYDYVPQGDSELAISEGDTIYILEKSGEDDWWKGKKKASGDEEDEPVGLIPNNYVEEAQPVHNARALYDYTRQTDEELSFKEDANIEVFDTSDPDWILVGIDGEYGFVPANYIEIDEDAPATPARPSTASRSHHSVEDDENHHPRSPTGSASGPAAAIAGIMQRRSSGPALALPPRPQYTPEASDEEEEGPTPSLPARPQSGSVSRQNDYASPRSPSSPGIAASPPHNRVSFRGDDDEIAHHAKGGFHLYNVNEMVSVMGKRKKMPTTLGINLATGTILIAPEKARDGPEQEWTAEKMTHYSIEGKHIFLELVRPSKSVDLHAGAKDTAQEIVAALGEMAGAVKAEGLREVFSAASGQGQKKGVVLYDFMAQGDDEVSVAVDDEVIILDDTKSDEWWQVRRLKNGKEGVVPSSYIEITGTVAPSLNAPNAGRSMVELNRLDEERLAKEALRASRSEEDSRGSEVGPGMKLPERGSSLNARDISNGDWQQRSRHDHKAHDSNQSKSSKSKPDLSKVRTWSDRSKSFSVEAQFLALKDGKIHLHKMNGVKIAVPVSKMSVEDLEYVERLTGVSLDEDKPLSEIKRQKSRGAPDESRSASGAAIGASIEQPQKPEYDWFQFFLSCDVAVGLCERYAQIFAKDSMDESVLPDVDSNILRNIGIREGDIIKVMRFLDNKYDRKTKKASITGDGDEESSAGGLFSGPGGALKNNTRKGRPAPAVQTNDVVDPKAFAQQDSSASTPKPSHEGVSTPLASAPIPAKKDRVGGFDDDAWDVKPARQQSPAQPVRPAQTETAETKTSHPQPPQPALTGSMKELSLLDTPLQPTKLEPTPPPAPQIAQPPVQQPSQPSQQVSQLTGATPSFFSTVNVQPTGAQPQVANGPLLQNPQLYVQQTGFAPQSQPQQNISRQRPLAPQYTQGQGALMIPPPPRPLSAPQAPQQNAFGPPPLQPQMTGLPNSGGFQQPSLAPAGQSLAEMNQMRMQQQFNQQQQQMYPQMTGFVGQQSNGMMPQPTGFSQMNPLQQQQNGFAPQMQAQQTGYPQAQPFSNGPMGSSPFADPRPQQFSPIQTQPTGFHSSFNAPPQYPQQTGVNSYLPPALQPMKTGFQQQPSGPNGFGPNFTSPPVPPMPQQPAIAPLQPQKTGPPPPVRFGVTGDTKKLMPQATGRRANLAQATPQNPFGF